MTCGHGSPWPAMVTAAKVQSQSSASALGAGPVQDLGPLPGGVEAVELGLDQERFTDRGGNRFGSDAGRHGTQGASGASGDSFGNGKGVDVFKKAHEIPTHPKTWHGILCIRHGPCGMEALLVQEIDSECYWKIFVSDLGDRKKIDTFGRNYAHRVRTMDTTQLSFLAGLSFTEFAHLVEIYREEEHKNDGGPPSYNVCVQRLCAEASDRPT